MIENSIITHHDVYKAFTKFQRVSSDHKFRTKSIRVKTISNEMQNHITQKLGLPVIQTNHSQFKVNKNMQSAKLLPNMITNMSIERERVQSFKIVEKNYEEELNNFGVDSQFLKKMFDLKCQETQTKYNEQRYQIFIKNVALRLCKYKHLPINQMGLGALCLQTFFEWFIEWEGHITDLDLSYASQLLKSSKMKIITNLLQKDKKMMKISLCNSNLDDDQLKQIFKIIIERSQLFSLDISNINSQSLNRLGDSLNLLNQFLIKNQSVTILKANNLHIKRQGFQHICRAISSRKNSILKILCLSNNHINGAQVCDYFCNLVRSGLTHLDLSVNPLGEQFYRNLPILKGATLRELSLQQTNMNSQNLYGFMQKIEECKTLSVLKLDKNDFSHHWFGKIGQKLQTNSCLQWISLNNCQIKSFLPLFQGLTLNRYLRRLDANNNIIDCDNQVPKKIVDCLTLNKNIEEIRFRYCNFNEFIISKIVEGLVKNQKLKHLDISENLCEDIGGSNILKMLQENQKIETIGIEKLQLSQQMRKRIYLKLKENKALREREEFGKLKNLTTDMKAKDGYTWEDVNELDDEERKLANQLKTAQQKVEKLEDIVATKKDKINEMIKICNEEERKMENMLKDKIRIENQRIRNAEKQVTRLTKQQNRVKELQIKEAQQMQRLQQKIRETNQKNKKRQNELEDKLRNLKYLQSKKKKNINGINFQSPPKRNSGHQHLH